MKLFHWLHSTLVSTSHVEQAFKYILQLWVWAIIIEHCLTMGRKWKISSWNSLGTVGNKTIKNNRTKFIQFWKYKEIEPSKNWNRQNVRKYRIITMLTENMPFHLTFFSSVVHCNFDSIESYYMQNKTNLKKTAKNMMILIYLFLCMKSNKTSEINCR